MLEIDHLNTTNQAYWETIYLEAFPKSERLPIEQIITFNDQHEAVRAGVLKADDEQVGIIFYVQPDLNRQMIFITYLAIDGSIRGKGYGHTIIESLIKQFSDGIILECEILDEQAENAVQRQRRYNFYIKNGFLDTGYYAKTAEGAFHLLHSQPEISIDEYFAALQFIDTPVMVTNSTKFLS